MVLDLLRGFGNGLGKRSKENSFMSVLLKLSNKGCLRGNTEEKYY